MGEGEWSKRLRVSIPGDEAFYYRHSIKEYSGYGKGESIPYSCSLGHSWIGVKGVAGAGVTCPYCWCREALPGFNDLASQFPSLMEEWEWNLNELHPGEIPLSSSKVAWWRCSSCGHSWSAIIRNRSILGSGCPACCTSSKERGDWSHRLRAAWSSSNGEGCSMPRSLGMRNNTLSARWNCESCGGEFCSTPRQLLRREAVHCATCQYLSSGSGSRERRERRVEEVRLFLRGEHVLSPQWSGENPPLSDFTPGDLLLGSGKFKWICSEGHAQEKSFTRKLSKPRCGYCSNRILLPGFNDLATCFPEVAALWSGENDRGAGEVTCGSGYLAHWTCPCGVEFTSSVVRMTREGRQCPGCGDASLGEKELRSFVESLLSPGEIVEVNNRSLIAPLELDIVLPARRISLEYNDIYWHSDEVISRFTRWRNAEEYHQHKVISTRERGYELLIVWEDDWVLRRGEVEKAVEEALSGGVASPLLLSTGSRYSSELGREVSRALRGR